ncbi:MAG: MATE family efflux transporter [Eubacteriales bacterium]|nr:MATE family efflux transporter [Eubacteriales bacterium]
MSKNVKDMTHGSPARLIVTFALPLMLGNIFQQLYTMTDAAIVGQFAGTDALGALGSADWLCWLVFGVIGGFMQGFSILVAQRFGGGDMRLMRRSVSTLVILAGIVAVVFTAAGLILTVPLLRLMGTLDRVFDLAAAYLHILYGGICVTAAYNLLSSLLRALGNSRSPLIAMVAASVTNIALDLLFVVVFHWDVAGAAAATVIAQGVATVICLMAVLKLEPLRFQKGEFAFHRGDAGQLLKLAAPMAFQNTMISVGGMAVQKVLNGLGYLYVTGFTATNKLYGLLEAAAVSFGYAITTYTGQNLGAGRFDRIRSGMRKAALIAFVTALCLTGVMFLAGRPCLSLFIASSADPGVMEVAVKYLHYMAAALFILYFLYVYRSALQGMGDTFMPMLSGLAECVMRVGTAWLLTLPALLGPEGIYFAEPAAWTGAAILLVVSYFHREHALEKEFQSKKEVSP